MSYQERIDEVIRQGNLGRGTFDYVVASRDICEGLKAELAGALVFVNTGGIQMASYMGKTIVQVEGENRIEIGWALI